MTHLQQKDTANAHTGILKTHKHTQRKKGQTRTAHTDNFQEERTLQLGLRPVSHQVSGLEFHTGPLLLTAELCPGLEEDASTISCKKQSDYLICSHSGYFHHFYFTLLLHFS